MPAADNHFDVVQRAATAAWLQLLTSVAPTVVGAPNETALFYTHLFQV